MTREVVAQTAVSIETPIRVTISSAFSPTTF